MAAPPHRGGGGGDEEEGRAMEVPLLGLAPAGGDRGSGISLPQLTSTLRGAPRRGVVTFSINSSGGGGSGSGGGGGGGGSEGGSRGGSPGPGTSRAARAAAGYDSDEDVEALLTRTAGGAVSVDTPRVRRSSARGGEEDDEDDGDGDGDDGDGEGGDYFDAEGGSGALTARGAAWAAAEAAAAAADAVAAAAALQAAADAAVAAEGVAGGGGGGGGDGGGGGGGGGRRRPPPGPPPGRPPVPPPLLSVAAATGPSPSPPPGSIDSAGAPAESVAQAGSRARQALRRAARQDVVAQRATRPYSTKGVPLLQRRSIAHTLRTRLGPGGIMIPAPLVPDGEEDGGAEAGGDGATASAGGGGGAGGASAGVGGGKGRPAAGTAGSATGLRLHAVAEEEAVPSEQHVKLAAQFVRDALANRNPNTRLAASSGLMGGGGTESKHAVRSVAAGLEQVLASRAYRIVFQLIVIAHCLLAVWETIPGSPWSPPFSWVVGGLELVFLCVYVADQVAVVTTFGRHLYLDKKWESVFLVVVVVAWADWLAFYAGGAAAMFRFSRPLRPLLGIAKRTSLRRLLASILRTVPKMVSVCGLLFIIIMFYGTLGQQLFNSDQVPSYNTYNDNFDSWAAAVLGVFVLSTTENYPNIANPAYHHRPVVATLYFASALFLMLWLILPLILAIVYDHYLEIHKGMVRAKRVKQYLSLVFAYQLLMGGDGNRAMDRDMFVRLVTASVPTASGERASVMFDVLDVDGSGLITIAEFLRLPTVLRVQITRARPAPHTYARPPWWALCTTGCWYRFQGRCRAAVQTRTFFWLAIVTTVAACVFGAMWTLEFQREYDACVCAAVEAPAADDNFHSDDQPTPGMEIVALPAGRTLAAALSNIATDLRTYLSWALGGDISSSGGGAPATASPGVIAAGLADPCEPGGATCAAMPVRIAMYGGLLAALLQACELVMRAVAHTPTSPGYFGSHSWLLASWWNILHVVCVAWGCVGYTALLAGAQTYSNGSVSDLFELARALPFLRLLAVIPPLRATVGIIVSILPLMARFMVVYLAITYGFAVVGVGIFGSLPQEFTKGFCQQCQMHSLASFPLSWLALLQLTVGNNWNDVLYPNMKGIGTRWAGLFFVLYRFFMTDVYMNIIEGVMIETYSRREEEVALSKEEAKVEAMLAQGRTEGGEPATARSGGVRYRPELFEELTTDESDVARRVAATPRGGAAGGRSAPSTPGGAATARGGGGAVGPDEDSGVIGISREELALLERALRRHEAALARSASTTWDTQQHAAGH